MSNSNYIVLVNMFYYNLKRLITIKYKQQGFVQVI